MRVNSQTISLGVTAIIIIILFALGETSAFVLVASPDKERVTSGEKINIHATIDLDEGERGVKTLTLRITGPENISCNFNANGTPIEACEGVTVKKLSKDDDYGYPNGDQKYKITLDTSFFSPGEYNIRIIVKSWDNKTSTKDVKIRIEFMCSLRAKDGSGEYGETTFNKNKINFFVSRSNSNDGSGSLVMQKNKNRLSISFIKGEIIKANDTHLILNVNGDGTFNRQKINFSGATITVDKNHSKVSFVDNTEDISTENMDIYFIKGC